MKIVKVMMKFLLIILMMKLYKKYLQRYHVYCCVLTQSLNKPADCSIIDQAIYFRGEHIIDLKDIKIVGDHNVQNIMIATTICLVAGVSLE